MVLIGAVTRDVPVSIALSVRGTRAVCGQARRLDEFSRRGVRSSRTCPELQFLLVGRLLYVDHRAVMFGRKPTGAPWRSSSIRGILTSEATLGYLVHDARRKFKLAVTVLFAGAAIAAK